MFNSINAQDIAYYIPGIKISSKINGYIFKMSSTDFNIAPGSIIIDFNALSIIHLMSQDIFPECLVNVWWTSGEIAK